MNATVYTYIDKAAALRETAEQQLFYVIGNSVGIAYYIKSLTEQERTAAEG